jgi:CRP-like cAMP-binding protein
MTDPNKLKKVSLFEGLSEVQLKKIAELAKETDYITGDIIFTENSPATCLYVILHGSVEILKQGLDRESSMAVFGAGSHFGEMALFDLSNRTSSAQAKDNCSVLEIPYGGLNTLMESDPKVGYLICRSALRAMCRRIRHTTSDLSSLKELKLKSI